MKWITLKNAKLLTRVRAILATHEWNRTESASFVYQALEWIADSVKLSQVRESQGELHLLQENWDDIVHYTRQHIDKLGDLKVEKVSVQISHYIVREGTHDTSPSISLPFLF